jgi:hypothetical protein
MRQHIHLFLAWKEEGSNRKQEDKMTGQNGGMIKEPNNRRAEWTPTRIQNSRKI